MVKTSFFPYTPASLAEMLEMVILSPIHQAKSRSGTLYMFRSEADHGFIKIGYTTQVLDTRLASIQEECGYTPIPIRQIRGVPNVERVEQLVHAELAQQRRRTTACLDKPKCNTVHKEWFETAESLALKVMENFSRWMLEAEPYDA